MVVQWETIIHITLLTGIKMGDLIMPVSYLIEHRVWWRSFCLLPEVRAQSGSMLSSTVTLPSS